MYIHRGGRHPKVHPDGARHQQQRGTQLTNLEPIKKLFFAQLILTLILMLLFALWGVFSEWGVFSDAVMSLSPSNPNSTSPIPSPSLNSGNVKGVEGFLMGISAAIGGLTSILPNLIFYLLLFKNQGAMAASKIVKSFYWGETFKIFLTVLLFTASFQWSNLKFFPMLFTFISIQLVYWLIPWLMRD